MIKYYERNWLSRTKVLSMTAVLILGSCGAPAGNTAQTLERRKASSAAGVGNQVVNPAKTSENQNAAIADTSAASGEVPVVNLAGQGSIANSGASFQVKSIDLLRSSIGDCVGQDKTRLSLDMINIAVLPESDENPSMRNAVLSSQSNMEAQKKVGFLVSSKYVDALTKMENLLPPKELIPPANPPNLKSEINRVRAERERINPLRTAAILAFVQINFEKLPDILKLEAENLVDTKTATRIGVVSDILSDGYMRSLGIIADVVAHNCDNSGNCLCETNEYASNMVKRCLPNVNPKEATAAIAALHDVCKVSKREAISSLIRSYAFASAR